jgi:hypothetical protein
MKTLVKCPFCLHESKLQHDTLIKLVDGKTINSEYNVALGHHEYYYKYYVECTYCNAKGPVSDDENEAIETWNELLSEVLLKNILNDTVFDEMDEDHETLVLNKKVHDSYVSIWFDVDTQKYIVYLLWYANGKLLSEQHRFRNICENFQDAISLFHNIYVKLLVSMNYNEIAEKCNLIVYITKPITKD